MMFLAILAEGLEERARALLQVSAEILRPALEPRGAAVRIAQGPSELSDGPMANKKANGSPTCFAGKAWPEDIEGPTRPIGKPIPKLQLNARARTAAAAR